MISKSKNIHEKVRNGLDIERNKNVGSIEMEEMIGMRLPISVSASQLSPVAIFVL